MKSYLKLTVKYDNLIDNFHAIKRYLESEMESVPNRVLTRMLIDGVGSIFMYSCFARQISFQFDKF